MNEFRRIMKYVEDQSGRMDSRKQLELTELALELALLMLDKQDVRNVCADVLRYQRAEWQATERLNAENRKIYQQRQEKTA